MKNGQTNMRLLYMKEYFKNDSSDDNRNMKIAIKFYIEYSRLSLWFIFGRLNLGHYV